MLVSQRCRYALRAVLELSRKYREGLLTSGEIADAQEIPLRFLEAILNQLAKAGLIASRRGSQGGYSLVFDPSDLTVGKVVRAIEGDVDVVPVTEDYREQCTERRECAFMGMWGRVSRAISEVYDSTTFKQLLEEEAKRSEQSAAPTYAI